MKDIIVPDPDETEGKKHNDQSADTKDDEEIVCVLSCQGAGVAFLRQGEGISRPGREDIEGKDEELMNIKYKANKSK